MAGVNNCIDLIAQFAFERIKKSLAAHRSSAGKQITSNKEDSYSVITEDRQEVKVQNEKHKKDLSVSRTNHFVTTKTKTIFDC